MLNADAATWIRLPRSRTTPAGSAEIAGDGTAFGVEDRWRFATILVSMRDISVLFASPPSLPRFCLFEQSRTQKPFGGTKRQIVWPASTPAWCAHQWYSPSGEFFTRLSR